jgi:hypothetical protein
MMDLAYAIWVFNPQATYILTADGTAIDQWFGPGPQPTQAQLNTAWATAQQQIAARAAITAFIQAHWTTIEAGYTLLTNNAALTTSDNAAIGAILTALQADTQPTAAQIRVFMRVVARAVIAVMLNGAPRQ